MQPGVHKLILVVMNPYLVYKIVIRIINQNVNIYSAKMLQM